MTQKPQSPEPRLRALQMSKIPAECLRCRNGESGYRRGASQAMSWAADTIHAGGSARDLDLATDIAMEMRGEHEFSGAFLDELGRRFRRAKAERLNPAGGASKDG